MYVETKQYTPEQSMGQKRNKKREKNLKTNKNGNRAHQNLRDVAKAVLRGKFLAISAYIKKIGLK